MEGDAFETEDQRNWSDASYKTYVRPLSKPRPYMMAKGTTDSQRITITLLRSSAKSSSSDAAGARLTIGEAIGKMPKIGLFLDEGFEPKAEVAEAASAQSLAAPSPGLRSARPPCWGEEIGGISASPVNLARPDATVGELLSPAGRGWPSEAEAG